MTFRGNPGLHPPHSAPQLHWPDVTLATSQEMKEKNFRQNNSSLPSNQGNLTPDDFDFFEMYRATAVSQLQFTARMLNVRSVGTNQRSEWTQAANERPGSGANQRVQKPDA